MVLEIKLGSIVAISTAIGNGGISIIRMSGDNVLNIASQVFSHPKIKVKNFEPRKMYLGTFHYENIYDQCMCVYFKAPHSYTGEDIIEFQCHGGITISNLIYESLIKCGCTPATKGEFSKIAFLNGKLTLDEAEGIVDMINAESESEIRAGYDLTLGKLKAQVEDMQNMLTTTLAKIEVALDYPEEDLEKETYLDIKNALIPIKEKIKNLLSTADTGRLIKDGVKILIFGKTNAGKSSLLNALLGYDRAIVTEIEGTTRDTLEETFIYNGYKFVLIDSAGIRQSDNLVESIGIEKSKDALKYADIVLFVIDTSVPLDNNDYDIMSKLNDKNTIVVANKSDLKQVVDTENLDYTNIIKISSKTGNGIDALKEKLFDIAKFGTINNGSVVITNARHKESLSQALDLINNAIASVDNENMLDLITMDIKECWMKLGDITGNSDNESIINEIFSKFCVGK